MAVRRQDAFVDDVTNAYSYLTRKSPRSADRLLDEIELLAAFLSDFPQAGRLRPRLGEGVRSFRVRRFRYILFYRIEAGDVVLLRLLHSARNIRRKTHFVGS